MHKGAGAPHGDGPAPSSDDSVCDAVEDRLLGGKVRLLQPRRGHRAGTDAVLLAAAVPDFGKQVVADVGAASGAVGLMIAARVAGTRVVFVEQDPMLLALCQSNVALNGGHERCQVVGADLLAPPTERRAAGLVSGSVDVVATNPPYLEAGRSRRSPEPGRVAAHEFPPDGLERWLRACADLLAPKGLIVVVHRADRITDLAANLGRGFGGLALRFVHPRQDEPAIRVLVSARKGSRAPLTVLPPLILHDEAGRFTPQAEAIHRGEAALN